jgi:hypothetical protein
VVASASVKAWGWLLAAALSAGFLGVFAFHGERQEPGLARFTAAGVLAAWPVQQVVSVDISAGARHRSFHRNSTGGWLSDNGGEAIPGDVAERIETGLTLLHNSAPQRTDLASGQPDEFGLAPPRLTVTAHLTGGASVAIEFGGTNSLGLERYARIVGHNEVWLLPAFVGDAWDAVAQAP